MGSIDPAQLSRWFDEFRASLSLYAQHWLEPALAEDAVQGVFVGLMKEESEPKNVKAWLFRAVRNAAIDQFRSRDRRQVHEAHSAGDRAAWFEPSTDDRIDAAAAQTALLKLAADEREIVVLRIWVGMTFKEIAAIVGQPLPTVFVRYREALAVLREILESSCRTKNH